MLFVTSIVESSRKQTDQNSECFACRGEEFVLSRLRQRIGRRKKEREILQPRRMPCNDAAHPGGRLKWRRPLYSVQRSLLLFFCLSFPPVLHLTFPSLYFIPRLYQVFRSSNPPLTHPLTSVSIISAPRAFNHLTVFRFAHLFLSPFFLAFRQPFLRCLRLPSNRFVPLLLSNFDFFHGLVRTSVATSETLCAGY